MAERDRTLAVAVAGIAATALVGLAGTGVAWLSGRDDRASQHELARGERASERELARQERIYERRVSAYLDAIDYLEQSNETFTEVELLTTDRSQLLWASEPPTRLTSRLSAFGSAQAVKAFENAQGMQDVVPELVNLDQSRKAYIDVMANLHVAGNSGPFTPKPGFARRLEAFRKQINRFKAIVHKEIG